MKPRTLMDAIKVMDKWHYDLISEEYDKNQGKHILTFENRYEYEDNGINKRYLLGNNFCIASYNDGHYYRVWKRGK